MFQGLLRNLDAAEHPCEFLRAFVCIERLNAGTRHFAIADLADTEMMGSQAGDLRQMCDAENLAFGAEIDTTLDEFLGDGSRYRLFASWFIVSGLELAGSVGRTEVDDLPGTSVDEDFYNLRILGRF